MTRAYSYPLFTMADIEARERLIQERTGLRGIDPVWLRIEALRELRLGIPAAARVIDAEFEVKFEAVRGEAAWSPYP